MEWFLKHWSYLKYILAHKFYVAIACFEEGLFLEGITHDWSKFLPDEWIPYAEYFQAKYTRKDNPETRPQSVVDAFNRAWLKHIQRNDHHWQHHLLVNDEDGLLALEMNRTQILHMYADWYSFAIQSGVGAGQTATWYKNQRDKQVMHPETRRRLELHMGVAHLL